MKKKNYSIEMLRFICMLGIIMIHVMNQGGIINSDKNMFSNIIISFLFYLVIPSVNIFAMITGFLYIEKDGIKYKNLINLLLALIFYSIFITIIFYGLNLFGVRNMGMLRLLSSLLPPIVGRYWYITCYIFLFCMIPYINIFIKNINKYKYKKFLLLLFVLLCIIDNFGNDLFKIESGYSPFWLVYCYMIGAFIKMYGINVKHSRIIPYILIITFINILGNILSTIIKLPQILTLIISYNSPFILIISILIFVLFLNISFKESVIIKFLSLTSFGVYLIHGNILIFDFILKNRFQFLLDYNIVICVVGIIVSSILIYIICSIIEYIRIKVFNLIGISKLSEQIGNKVDRLIVS